MALEDYDVASGTFTDAPTADPAPVPVAAPPPFETRETTDRGGLPPLPEGWQRPSEVGGDSPTGDPNLGAAGQPIFPFQEEAPLEDWSWADVPNAVVIGSLRIKRGFNALGRAISGDNSEFAKQSADYENNQITAWEEHYSRGMQQRLAAPLLSGRGMSFGSLLGRAGEMAPALIAAVVPGGVIGDGIGVVAAAVVNGTMTAGDAAAEVQRRLDPLTPEQWVGTPLYERYIKAGKSPEEAASLAESDTVKGVALIAGGVGTVAGAAGAPGLLVAGAPAKFAASLSGRLAYNVLSGGAAGAAQAGTTAALIADVEKTMGMPPSQDIAQAMLEGGVMGAATALPGVLHKPGTPGGVDVPPPHLRIPEPAGVGGEGTPVTPEVQVALNTANPPSAPGAPGTDASKAPAAGAPGAGDPRDVLQQRVADLADEIEVKRSTGEDTTDLEAQLTAAKAALDAAPVPVAPAPTGEPAAGGEPPVPPVGPVPPDATLTPGETPAPGEVPPVPPAPEVAAGEPPPATPESNVPPDTSPIPSDLVVPGAEPAPPTDAGAPIQPAPEPVATVAPVATDIGAPTAPMQAAPDVSLPGGVGPAGAEAITAGKRPRVLQAEMTPEAKAADIASRKARKADQARVRRAEAADARAEAAVEGTQPRAPTKRGKIKDAAILARADSLLAVHAAGETDKLVYPKTKAQFDAFKEHIGKLATAVETATADSGGVRSRVSKVAHGVEAFAADTVSLHNALEKPWGERVAKQAGEYLRRLATAKNGDFSTWKSVRKIAAEEAKRGPGGTQGGVEVTKAVGEADIGKRVGAGGAGTGMAEKFEPVPAKAGVSLKPGTPEFQRAAAEALAKTEGAKVTPRKAGITPGKTEEVAPKAKAKAEPAKAEKPPEPAPQSHAGVDKGLADAADMVGRARKRVEEAKGGGALQVAKVALRKAEDRLEVVSKLAEARDKRGGLKGTQEEIDKARRDLRTFTDERVQELRDAGPDRAADLQNALDRRAAAHATLELEDTGLTQRGMGARDSSGAGRQSILERVRGRLSAGGHVMEQVNRAVRHMRSHFEAPVATHAHTIIGDNGQQVHFRSVIDTTVGELIRDVDTSRLATHIYGLGGPEASALIDRILALADDTKVHFIDQARDFPALDKNYGTHLTGRDEGRIILDIGSMHEEAGKPGSQRFFERVILHEALHEITVHAYDAVPRFRQAIDELYAYAKTALPEGLYGLKNTDEFIAEAFSSPSFHAMLRDLEAPEHMVKFLRLDEIVPNPSVWDAFVGYIRQVAIKLGLREAPSLEQHSVIDAMARAIDEVTADGHVRANERGAGTFRQRNAIDPARAARELRDFSLRTIAHAMDRPQPPGEISKVRWLKVATTDYIARAADRFFGRDTNPVRDIARLFERIRVDAAHGLDAAMGLTDRMFKAERAVGQQGWAGFANFLADERHAGVFADRPLASQPHLTKNGLGDVQGKYRHAELATRYRDLPQVLKDLRKDLLKHYMQEQNKTTMATIKNRLLRAANIPLDKAGEALANRIFLDKMTDADEARLGPVLTKALKATNMLKKVDGPYYPAMRRGDHVVSGVYRVDAPPAHMGATRIRDDNGELLPVWEFGAGNVNKSRARKDAMRYAARLPQHAKVKSVWVNENTGKLYQEGDDVPVGQRVMKEDPNSDHRWRVEVQDQHVEFVFNRKVANRRRNELAATGAFERVDNVRERREENFPRGGYLASQLRGMREALEKQPGWNGMTRAMQQDLQEALREASMRLYSSTRIETRSLPFRYVAGAGREITKDLVDYSRASSGRLAQLTHAHALDQALERMDTMAGDQHPQVYGRSAIANEIRTRASSPDAMSAGKGSAIVNRMMGLSFSTNLGSPSYTLINLTQNPMLTFPVLAARHGVFRAARELHRGYGLIGAGRQLGKGARETGRALAGKSTDYGYLTDIRARLASHPELVQLLDRAIEIGNVDPEVGLEMAGMVDRSNAPTPGGQALGAVDASLAYLGGIARHLPRAAEVINRVPALIAAYRLERSRGAAHEAAMDYAFDTVNQTQFNYASSNRAPVFNKPVIRLLTQFKQYPIHVMQLFAENFSKAYHAIRAGNHAEAAEAVKAMTYIMATHTVMAGALGLPTEPFKLAIVAMGALGVPVPTWDEVQDIERQAAAAVFGRWGGLAFSKGLPAALGVDLSGNLGLQNGITYGGPGGYDWRTSTMWIVEQLLGSPLGQGEHYLKGAQAIANGDWETAAVNFSPLKVLTNMADAVFKYGQGKVNPQGRTTAEPYSLGNAAIRAFGLRPTAETEHNTAQGLLATKNRNAQTERNAVLNDWATTDPSTRSKKFKDILEWNKGRPAEERLTRSQLDDYARRREREVMGHGQVISGKAEKARSEALTPVYGP